MYSHSMHVLRTSDSLPSDFESELAGLQPQLRYFALSLTGSMHDAEEVIQNANRIAIEKAGEFEKGSNLKAWLFKIASLQAKSFHRNQSRKRGFEIVDDDLLKSISEEPEQEDAFEKERAALLSCLEQLRPAHQELITARYVHGRKVSELAVEQEILPNALAQKLFRIRNRLADCIESRLKES
ncbi:MAG: sigma-70 family RNA polymerase sigma factor [Verrucomicrobiales bacterium]|nr:sigma-70 family RNA polymerase sigma factor [Verrucomicrobiales bacterium]